MEVWHELEMTNSAYKRELTQTELERVRANGYLHVPQLTHREEATRIRSSLELLFSQRAGENEGNYGELARVKDSAEEANSPQILLPVNYAPELHKTECFKNALQIAKQILGKEAHFFLDVTIFKRARDGSATPWHQDAAFRDPTFEYNEVSFWIALQDVDEQSSCLKFLPGSQRKPVVRHRPRGGHVDAQALECAEEIDVTGSVACPLTAGDCTIHFPGTLHCSTPNFSPVPRIAYILTFGTAPIRSKNPATFPWLEQRNVRTQSRRRWMLRGGLIVTAWRRLRRGDLRNWNMMRYWALRTLRIVRHGR